MIRAKGLDLGHGQAILKNLNFEIKGAEITALLGKNGIGKSTLLKTIAGFIPALAGEIVYPKGFGVEFDLSFVSSEKIEIPYLSVREVVSYGRYPFSNLWGDLGPMS